MYEKKIIEEIPSFTNTSGETLMILNILDKKITSITVGYLEYSVNTCDIIDKAKNSDKVSKEVTIVDPKGIDLNYPLEQDSATIRFCGKKEYEKLEAGKFCEETIMKSPVAEMGFDYRINFHIANLVNIDWEHQKN